MAGVGEASDLTWVTGDRPGAGGAVLHEIAQGYGQAPHGPLIGGRPSLRTHPYTDPEAP